MDALNHTPWKHHGHTVDLVQPWHVPYPEPAGEGELAGWAAGCEETKVPEQTP